MIRFLLVLIISTLIAGGGTWLLVDLGTLPVLPSFFYQTLVLLPACTFFIYRYLVKANNPAVFTQLYLLTMVIKLIAFLTYNMIMVFEDRAGAVPNVLFFLSLYVLFTALEVIFLYRRINPN